MAVPFASNDAMNAIMPTSCPREDTTNQHVKFGALSIRLAARCTEKSKSKSKSNPHTRGMHNQSNLVTKVTYHSNRAKCRL
jgi:hypothetical protein